MINAEAINLFPLTLYKSQLVLNESLKKEMVDEILNMKKNSMQIEYKDKNSAWTGDTQGYEKIFENIKFKFFFEEISKHIKKYLEYFMIDDEKLDCYFQRSWATISDGKENINLHVHSQSHLSFAYYLKLSEGDSSIQFKNNYNQNEFIPSLFASPSINMNKIFKSRNLRNVYVVDIKCKENDLLIFPSKILHGTQANLDNNKRISISADIVFFAKDSKNIEHLMPPLNSWKKIN